MTNEGLSFKTLLNKHKHCPMLLLWPWLTCWGSAPWYTDQQRHHVILQKNCSNWHLQVLVCLVLCTAANISTRAFVSSLVFVTPHTCLCFSFLVNKIMFSNLACLVSRHCHWLCGSLWQNNSESDLFLFSTNKSFFPNFFLFRNAGKYQ